MKFLYTFFILKPVGQGPILVHQPFATHCKFNVQIQCTDANAMTNRDARSVKRTRSILIALYLQLEESMNKLNARFFIDKKRGKAHKECRSNGQSRDRRRGASSSEGRENRSLSHLRSRDPPSADYPRTGWT